MPPVAFRASRAAIAFILVTAMLDVLSMGIVIPVLPTLIEQFTGSNARAGIINGVFVALWALMQFLAPPVIGSLSDQHGRRPVILVSTAGLAIDYVLMKSEEHTSELQSLMRISYAVFCLKNKKT